MNTVKRQHRTVGGIVKIPLKDGYHAYDRILPGAFFAFYDCDTKQDIDDLQSIIDSPILFITAVENYAVTKGLWRKVGKLPLEETLLAEPKRFIQDPIQPDKLEIIENGIRRKATLAECKGLERETVWEPEAIQQRMLEYYSGKTSKWLQQILDIDIKPKGQKERVNQYIQKILG
ncbi:MAG: immunity 26/phosphotriesterase HocA family protein [Spirochaetota bacterium]